MAKVKRNVKGVIPANRIRAIRTDLGMSLDDLAEKASVFARSIDPNNPDIIFQTVSRLEKGDIILTTEWMYILCGAFNLKVESEKYKPWHLIASEEDFEKIIQSEEEFSLLKKRRALEENEQKIFDAMTEANANTLKEIKKNN